MSKGRKKKNKVRYIDDGRTVADMSALRGGAKSTGSKSSSRGPSSGRDKWNTYKSSVKMMFVPMLITMLGIAVIFGIIYLILTIAELKM